jgi:MFS family permease
MASQTRLAAFRYRDFRLLWMAELASTTGSQIQTFAVNWHVFRLLQDQTLVFHLFGTQIELGGEALGLGGLGLARLAPIIAFSLLGGVMADAYDRRKLMITTRILAALLGGWLALLTLAGRADVLVIYIISALASGLMAFDLPARQSLVPHLVPTIHLTNAISLQSIIWQLATITGPALAGILISAAEGSGVAAIGVVYIFTALLFTGAVGLLLRIHYGGQARSEGVSWRALEEGMRFTFSTSMIRGTMLLDFLATFFGSARTMLPIVASDLLGMGAAGYGLLATAQPLGALMAGSLLALRREIKHQGAVLLVSVAVYGAATAVFGLSTSFALSYIMYGLTGAGDATSAVIRNTIRQTLTPDRLRGRMTGVNMIFANGGPQLGELEAGLVGAALGVPFAIVTGGIATVLLTSWIALRYPKLGAYQGDTVEVAR